MLTEFSIKNVASYNEIGTTFKKLNKVNFIYGNNGTGKSTFSKAIYRIGEENYRDCEYKGKMIDTRLVYNKNFIEDNFQSDNDIPGIFTLGKDDIDKQSELERLQRNIDRNKEDQTKAEEQIESIKNSIVETEQKFINNIWNKKVEKTNIMYELYQHAFKGLHNSKKLFYDKYCNQLHSDKFECNIESLSESAKIVFAEEKIELKKTPTLEIKYEVDDSLFNKSIIGKEDLEFADLIDQLDMQTWVLEGYKNIQDNNLDYCPFCRSKLNKEIVISLSEYFDEKFEKEMNKLHEDIYVYNKYADSIMDFLQKLYTLDNRYIEKDIIENIHLKIKAGHEENLKYISEKQKTPSNKIKLKLFIEELSELREHLELYNQKIEVHNNTVREVEAEKKKIIKGIWQVFLKSTEEEYKQFKKKMKELKSRLKGYEETVEQKQNFILKDNKKLDEIKANLFGITSTVDAINRQLKLYGFRNFFLEAAEEEGKYKIVRENGEDANKTLSEGEKTFVTFLYFYHIVKSNEDKKLIFIDDPISSLDSTILYIVSTLVKDLIENHSKYKIEQLFISTHNTYFFKEITYKISNCSYYIIRKNDKDGSYVTSYEKNPITTSYESLWKELVELSDSSANIIQNVMRRILENYFKFHGGIDLDNLVNYFDEDERMIVASLIKWTHDGSHHIQEDLYVQQTLEMNEKYFDIFTKIFVKSGNEGHLKMMIEKCITSEGQSPFKLFQKQIA